MPGRVAAATVDHGLRAESAGEARHAAAICAALSVPHAVIRVTPDKGNVQAMAREARYAGLAQHMSDLSLPALATAHHADDQAETLLMRLNRGSGLSGLAGIRGCTHVPGTELTLLRPLLRWRRAELAKIVEASPFDAVEDPSNTDRAFDRVRIRGALAEADWLDVAGLARSARHLADAQDVLDCAVAAEMADAVVLRDGLARYRPAGPRAVRLAVLERLVGEIGGGAPRGGAIAKLIERLDAGESGNVAGAMVTAQDGVWYVKPEPARR